MNLATITEFTTKPEADICAFRSILSRVIMRLRGYVSLADVEIHSGSDQTARKIGTREDIRIRLYDPAPGAAYWYVLNPETGAMGDVICTASDWYVRPRPVLREVIRKRKGALRMHFPL